MHSIAIEHLQTTPCGISISDFSRPKSCSNIIMRSPSRQKRNIFVKNIFMSLVAAISRVSYSMARFDHRPSK
ncbi:hypothetical protein BS50DRAFT_206023 [Corynespora cassiicola Philippines]|uniref:Uncharacterized protein n=1 Tax=Corynespora cassiicola Philippines TaxID=1448308 RepID=A0A2T2N5E0_CORCC|nr:hypothetical protein BS50DRAFT_206023 [Corynespora cassiicola Philippines]